VKAFLRQSHLARATIRYWSELKERARSGETPRIDPLSRLSSPELVESFLSIALARDDIEEREAICRDILAGWIDMLRDWVAIAYVQLAEVGRKQRVDDLVQKAREGAMSALRAKGVRNETLMALDRLFASAVEAEQELAEARSA
jgi:hypothetical protein